MLYLRCYRGRARARTHMHARTRVRNENAQTQTHRTDRAECAHAARKASEPTKTNTADRTFASWIAFAPRRARADAERRDTLRHVARRGAQAPRGTSWQRAGSAPLQRCNARVLGGHGAFAATCTARNGQRGVGDSTARYSIATHAETGQCNTSPAAVEHGAYRRVALSHRTDIRTTVRPAEGGWGMQMIRQLPNPKGTFRVTCNRTGASTGRFHSPVSRCLAPAPLAARGGDG